MQDTQEKKENMHAGHFGEGGIGRDATLDHVVKYTGFMGMVQVLTILVSVVRNKLAAVFLGTAGLGLSSLYTNLTNFLSNVSNLGIPFSSIKHVAELYEQGDIGAVRRYVEVVRTWSVWTALFGTAVCFLFSPIISWFMFRDFSHTLAVCFLSPVLAFMAVTAGELAILKAVHRLKRVALISVTGALTILALTVPFFYLWGIDGVVPGLVFGTGGVMVVHLMFSLRVFPWKVSLLNKEYYATGMALVRLGVPYVVAGLVNTACGLLISIYIANAGSWSDAGLYGMGYSLVFVYAGTFFTAVDSDYFPRLSAINTDCNRMNATANRQIKVCLLLISPILIVFMLAMPLLVCILYTAEFLPVVSMVVFASLHLFFKAMTLPVAYFSLAKGDAVLFLMMEVVYDVMLLALVVGLFQSMGIVGTGIALALAGLLDWLLVYVVYGKYYGFRMDCSFLPVVLMQLVCVMGAVGLALQDDIMLKVGGGCLACLCSVLLSAHVLRREMTLFSELKAKLRSKFGRRIR